MHEKKQEKSQSIQQKIKEGISVQELEHFARKYTNEGLAILATFFAAISSMFHFFSGAAWSIAFASLGLIFSIAMPEKSAWFLNKLANFFCKAGKTIQLLVGILAIVIALFLPFFLFGVFGLLAGAAYHYYVRKGAEKKINRKKEEGKSEEGEQEHL